MKNRYLILLLGACLVSNNVIASPLENPYPYATINDRFGVYLNNNWFNNDASSSTASINLADSYGSSIVLADAIGGNSPSMSLQISATASTADLTDRWGAMADIYMTYYYKISSSSNGIVPLTYSFSAGHFAMTTGSAWYFSHGEISIGPGIHSFFTSRHDTTDFFDGTLLGDHLESRSVNTNIWYRIDMRLVSEVFANTWAWNGGTQGSGTASVSAFIDPTISIDTTWLAENPGSRIVFATLQPLISQAILPNTLILLGSGLAGMAGAFLRKRIVI